MTGSPVAARGFRITREAAIAGAVGIAGFVIVLVATRSGLGLSPDSATYVGSARSLLDGRGLELPVPVRDPPVLTQAPPLYPMTLAFVGLTGVDIVAGGRWLNAVLCAALAVSVVLVVSRGTGSLAAGALASLAIVTAPDLIAVHIMAWSEVFGLAAIIQLRVWARDAHGPPQLLAAFAVSYALLLWLNASFFDAHASYVNPRYMSPVLIATVILAAWAIADWWRTHNNALIAKPLVAIAIASVALIGARGAATIPGLAREGRDFASRSWTDSPTMAEVRTIGRGPVYSNWPDAIYLATGRPARFIPYMRDPHSLRPNPNIEPDFAQLREAVAHGAHVVLFDRTRPGIADKNMLLRNVRLRAVSEARDGSVYVFDP